MQARTLRANSELIRRKEKCLHCGRRVKAGEQVLSHDLGVKAAWDVRFYVNHAACVRLVLDRLGPPPASPDAAEWDTIIERIRAGGPVLVPNG